MSEDIIFSFSSSFVFVKTIFINWPQYRQSLLLIYQDWLIILNLSLALFSTLKSVYFEAEDFPFFSLFNPSFS